MALRTDSDKQKNRKRFWNRLAVLSFLGLAVLIILIEFPGPASCSTTPATYFVLAGGAGNCSGTDWNNAAGKIPSRLNPGDIVYLGGSTGNLANAANTPCAGERSHTFSSSGTSILHIQIIKCTSSITACTSAAGWNAAYGTNAAQWIESLTLDGTLKLPFWQFCGSYYDANGSYGTSDQTGTYGIYMQANTRMYGFIAANQNACGNSANITNLTFTKIEINGVSPNSLANGNAGANGIFFGSPASTAVTVQNTSFTYMYIHDVSSMLNSGGNVIGVNFGNNWVYRNFSNAAQHSNAIDTQAPLNNAAFPGISNLTVYDSVFRNIQGTGIITCLNGVCDGWKIYNNVFWYDPTFDSTCEYGDTTATCGVSKTFGDNTPGGVVTNAVFYGNTVYGIHLKAGHAGADEAGVVIQIATSTGNSAQNNLFFGNTNSGVFTTANVAHDYNVFVNTAVPTTTLSAHEFHSSSGTADPFVSSANGNFTLASTGSSAPKGCAAGTNCFANGVTLPVPYNVDITGTPFGGVNGWTRGAYEYGSNSVVGTGVNPPTFLTATVQ